ncbi:MAG: S9 family peptidase, partial [Acidobacteria bacterium]|nr:S9 family peptidase [Acidobacteriota bacterium]
MRSIFTFVFFVPFCLNPVALSAQPGTPAKPFALTIDNIMRGPDLVGYEPTSVRWSPDSKKVYFSWKRAGEPIIGDFSTYVVDADGSNLRKLTDEEAKQAPPNGDVSDDKKWTVYTDSGDIFLYNNQTGARRQLTKTSDVESNPRFIGDQHSISFTRGGNLYEFSLAEGLLEQETDIRLAGAPDPTAGGGRNGGQGSGAKATESQESLKKDEIDLFDVVRQRVEKRDADDKKRKDADKDKRKPFQLSMGQNVGNLSLSPDGKYVIAVINENAVGARNTIVPNFVTDSGYTEDIPGRTKVGDPQGRNRIAIINVVTGESKWVDHGQRAVEPTSKTEGNNAADTPPEKQGAARGNGNQPPQPRDREVQLFAPIWSDDGKHAVLQARSVDNKDRWIMQLDTATGQTKVLAAVHDEAWIGGPGSFTLGWLPDNKRVYYESERDGFAHLYTVSIDGGESAQLTSGQFEVSDIRLSNDKTKFYFTSSEGSFFDRNLYSMPTGGGQRTRLTSMTGNNAATISPDETKLAIIRSYSNKPPELYIAPNKPGVAESEIKQVTDSPTAEWKSYNWIVPPIVSFTARDGATVYGRLYKPANYEKGGPAVVFVHGAGYLQNVHNWWSSYYREYMFHHFLMEHGYLVFDIDYRGSAGYGRDWRTGIYRFMGGKDLTDQVDGTQYLVNTYGVDP